MAYRLCPHRPPRLRLSLCSTLPRCWRSAPAFRRDGLLCFDHSPYKPRACRQNTAMALAPLSHLFHSATNTLLPGRRTRVAGVGRQWTFTAQIHLGMTFPDGALTGVRADRSCWGPCQSHLPASQWVGWEGLPCGGVTMHRIRPLVTSMVAKSGLRRRAEHISRLCVCSLGITINFLDHCQAKK